MKYALIVYGLLVLFILGCQPKTQDYYLDKAQSCYDKGGVEYHIHSANNSNTCVFRK